MSHANFALTSLLLSAELQQRLDPSKRGAALRRMAIIQRLAGDPQALSALDAELRTGMGSVMESASDDDDSTDRAEVMADLLLRIYGDDALSLFHEAEAGARDAEVSESLLEAWSPESHPRGKNGRFIKRNSAEAVEAAHEAVHATLRQPKSKESFNALLNHLNILSVGQIHDLKGKYGMRGSGKTRAELVEKIASRLDRGRREDAEPEKPEEKGETTGKVADSTKLTGDNGGGWPKETTLGELKTLAKKKLGKRYRGVVVKKYGGGSQVEVLSTRNGYHGVSIGREAVYPLPEEKSDAETSNSVSAGEGSGLSGKPEGSVVGKSEGTASDAAGRIESDVRGSGDGTDSRSGDSEQQRKEDWQMTREDHARLWHDNISEISKSMRGPSFKARSFDQAIKNLVDAVETPEEAKEFLMGLKGAGHKESVAAALAAGKPVPPEVMADYPDLQAKPALSATAPEPGTAKDVADPEPVEGGGKGKEGKSLVQDVQSKKHFDPHFNVKDAVDKWRDTKPSWDEIASVFQSLGKTGKAYTKQAFGTRAKAIDWVRDAIKADQLMKNRAEMADPSEDLPPEPSALSEPAPALAGPGEEGGIADAELDSMKADYSKITASQREAAQSAVTDYALGESYKIINPYLRGTGDDLGEYEETVKEDVDNLATAIDQAGHTLNKDITVYRGVGEVPFSTEVGTEFEDKGFASGSSDKVFSSEFVGGYGKKGEGKGYLIEMKVPKGHKVLVPLGSANRKKEVILQHGTKFKVMGKQGNVIQIEVVPATPAKPALSATAPTLPPEKKTPAQIAAEGKGAAAPGKSPDSPLTDTATSRTVDPGKKQEPGSQAEGEKMTVSQISPEVRANLKDKGNRLTISGDTRPAKEALKAKGWKWDPDKQHWYMDLVRVHAERVLDGDEAFFRGLGGHKKGTKISLKGVSLWTSKTFGETTAPEGGNQRTPDQDGFGWNTDAYGNPVPSKKIPGSSPDDRI